MNGNGGGKKRETSINDGRSSKRPFDKEMDIVVFHISLFDTRP